MKINMMIGGIETLFPDAEIRYSKKTNEVVICFLKINKEDLIRTEKNIKKAHLRIENDYIILKLKDFQYAYDLNQNENLMNLYMQGFSLGFAFKDENDNILDIESPIYSHKS